MSNKDFDPFTGKIQESEGVENNSFFHRFWDILKKNKITLVCLFLLGIIIFLSVFIFLSPYDPDKVYISEKYMPSGKLHIWGTDAMGRDYFTRAFYGGRVSLSIGLFSMIIATIWGTIYGTICGYMGGKIDAFLMRGVDIFMPIPSFILIVVISSYMSPSVPVIIFIIALFSWMGVARIVRAGTMSLKERDFVMASAGLGASGKWIVVRHIIPGMLPEIIVSATVSVAHAILIESALSFLGFGVQLPTASWGSMLQTAQKDVLTNPMLALYPGMLILITVLSFHLLGDTLRETLEPGEV